MAVRGGIEWKNETTVNVGLLAALRGIDPALKNVAREYGQKLDVNIKKNLYPGHGYDTGHLRTNVIHNPPEQIGVGTVRLTELDEVFYGIFVEKGTRRWGGKKFPFFEPGIKVSEEELPKIFDKHFHKLFGVF